MSEALRDSVAKTLKQSLLDLKDQMSVYTTQPWSENGHGYSDVDPYTLRDSPAPPPGSLRVGAGTMNPLEQRRHTEREMEVHARGSVHAHFEGSRNKLHGPGDEYGSRPIGGPPMENGHRDDHFHCDNRPLPPFMDCDIDRSRTDPGYFNDHGPMRQYGPDIRPYRGGERPYPPFDNDGPRCDYHHQPPLPPPSMYPGGSRNFLPDDRNQGMRRGYDAYSPTWSPTIDPPDSTSSPNAYPPPPPHPPPPSLRHSESFPMDGRKIVERPPFNHRPNRSPAEAQWRSDAQRRGYLVMRTGERYFRGDMAGPPYRHQQPNQLSVDRDPRRRRAQPSHGSPSPQSSTLRISNARRVNQIFSEHCYCKKSESEIGAESTSSSTSQSIESKTDTRGIPRHMLSQIPPAISIKAKSPSPSNLKTPCSRAEFFKNVSKLIILESSKVPFLDSKKVGEVTQPDTTTKLSKKAPPNPESTKNGTLGRAEEADQVQRSVSEGIPSSLSPTLSLNSFQIDLDTEPESSSDDEAGEPPVLSYRSQEIPLGTSSVRSSKLVDGQRGDESKVDQPDNRILRNGTIVPRSTNPIVHMNRRQPVAVVDNKVTSVVVSLSHDSIHDSSSSKAGPNQESDSQSGQQTRTRRSKRLATSQDTVLEQNCLDKEPAKVSNVAEAVASVVSKGEEEVKDTTTVKKEEMTKEERMLYNLAHARAVKARKEAERRRQKRAEAAENVRVTRATQSRKRKHDEHPLPPPRRRRKNTDFVPEILHSKSRTESATLERRREMEMQIQQHEKERLETARPEEHEARPPPMTIVAEPTDSYLGDDISSQGSTLSSHDVDSASKSSLLDEFPPDIAFRAKRVSSVRSSSGDSPLHKVCRNGKYDLVKYFLVIEKLNVNAQDYAGWTPLHEACNSGHIRVAELLLQQGADANLSAGDGTRPIHDAIEVGSLELVKLLIQHGADPLAEQGENTPVEIALKEKQPEIHAYLQYVVEELKAQLSKLATSFKEPVKTTKAPTRAEEKKRHTWEGDNLMIPVDGYTDDDPKFGAELDHPLFYVAPIMEMSDVPFLPVYNMKIVQGKNPRSHNFHLLSDVLSKLRMTESELRKKCHGIRAVELTVEECISRISSSFKYNGSLPPGLKDLSLNTKVKLIPLCAQLRHLFDVEVQNMDA